MNSPKSESASEATVEDTERFSTIFSDLTNSIEAGKQVRRAIERALITRDTLVERREEIVSGVGTAKAHLEIKDQVLATLQRIQSDALEATVGVYQKLLSALVNDVVDENKEIAVDLGTDRGQPAIYISNYVKGAPEYKSSLFDGSGGAMTNVVCVGLRCISVVRSGGRRLLVLDEPDCWIRQSRVAAFYKVLRQLCHDIGFQIVVISHHPAETFGDEARVVSLERDRSLESEEPGNDDGVDDDQENAEPKKGRRRRKKKVVVPGHVARTTKVSRVEGGTDWSTLDASHPGIRRIDIQNLATLKDVSIELDPHLTVIAGDIDIGKSRITRAFRSALYGEVDDGDIRFGEKSLSIELLVEGGNTLNFSRELKRTPINMWVMKDAEGEVMSYDGRHCSEGGRTVPEWLHPMLGIVRTDGLDMQISHQKTPVFLLDLHPTRQAAVLSIGQEIKWLKKMQSAYRDRVLGWNHEIRSGESEIQSVVQRIEGMSKIQDISNTLEAALLEVEKSADNMPKVNQLLAASKHIASQRTRLDRSRLTLDRVEMLPTPPSIKNPEEIAVGYRIADRIQSLHDRSEKLNRQSAVLQALPVNPPEIQDHGDPRRYADRITALRGQHENRSAAVTALANLPPSVPELPKPEMMDAVSRISSLRDRKAKQETILRALDRLPENPSSAVQRSLDDTQKVRTSIGMISDLNGRLGASEARLQKVESDITKQAGVYNALVEEAGDLCPVCGGPVHEVEIEDDQEHNQDHQQVIDQPHKSGPVVTAAHEDPQEVDDSIKLDFGF